MKSILILAMLSGMAMMTSSCTKSLNKFLEKAPGVDVTEDIVFSRKSNVDAYISTLYEYGSFSFLPARNNTAIIVNPATGTGAPTQIGTLSAATDEGKNESTFQFANQWNSAGVNSSNIIANEDYRYYARWKTIRIANILIARVDELTEPAATDLYKKQVKAQAKFFRALQNFEMLKRYGGFPIILSRFTTTDSANVPRSSFADCVDIILKDCAEALPDLEVSYPASQRGRVTRLSVLALRAKTLLYAASPLFNTATPYLSMPNAANNNLISYGNYDKNRWKLAADAAMDVLSSASAAGVSLVDVVANRIPADASTNVTSFLSGNYRVSWESQDNTEVILADKSVAATSIFGFPWQHLIPTPLNSGTTGNGYYGGTSILLNFVKKYEDKQGNTVNWDNAGGNDLTVKYASLDPRFKQSIAYTGSRWNNNDPIVETFTGGKNAKGCFGGQWLMKPLPEAIASGGSAPASMPMFRLNESYLNYAEAMNEFQGPGAASATGNAEPPAVPTSPHDAVNRIRARSGMPKLPASLSQDQFRVRVRNERAIELAFEDHRFWDIRRWMIAEEEGVMKGAMFGLRITKLNTTPVTYNYLPYQVENRSFNKKMYLHPFDLNEVLKGNLVQNPGW